MLYFHIFFQFPDLFHPNLVTMSNGESTSNCEPSKKRKVDDADGSEDDSECEDMNRSFCIYTNTDDFDSSKWICE